MTGRHGFAGLALVALIAAGGALAVDRFEHPDHEGLFPRCASCHAGIEDTTKATWPTAAQCAECHDGTVEDTVSWTSPTPAAPSNLNFAHTDHLTAVSSEHPDSIVTCEACHSTSDSLPMDIERARAQRCLACHQVAEEHLAAAQDQCAECHLPLAQATALTVAQIGDFPVPPSHDAADFAGPGHGRQARPPEADYAVAASCATCHAQDFCLQCHVDGPEQAVIQALPRDARALAISASIHAPASHQDSMFYLSHGPVAEQNAASCRACHTQESCLECHATRPAALLAMHPSGPERGAGASVTRTPPASHNGDFKLNHADLASSAATSCATCHERAQCLECHRPDPGQGAGGFHPAGFLSRHPVSAYNQETQCADCHNTGQFCASCHVNSGIVSNGPLQGGYHDAKQFFALGHGQSARQNLESCVSCHTERDCLRCHSALGGRRFNPHGPDFDAERLRKRNPQMCSTCHGFAIPG